MKRIAISILTLSLALASCADWLDVPPSNSISDKVLFESEEGFQEAVVGLYTTAAGNDLYGGIFTMELADAMMQNYSYGTTDVIDYQETSQFDFSHGMTRQRFSLIWGKAYNAIANCNLILENLPAKVEEGIFHTDMAEIVEAEARAMRAYLHFDMLRLCAPITGNPGNDAGRNAIPYVKEYSNMLTGVSTANNVITEVIADLLAAKQLLEGRDPILHEDYEVGFPTTAANGVTPEQNITIDGEILPYFLQNRRHRMNYYAVCGALARVYMWKATAYGDASAFELAAQNAYEVIEANKFKWVDANNLSGSETLSSYDREFYRELVFAFYIQDKAHVDALRNRYNNLSGGYYVDGVKINQIYELGSAVGTEDLRRKWFKQGTGTDADKMKIIKYLRNTEADDNSTTSDATSEMGNLHYLVSPQIRLSEMYYIVAECVYKQPGIVAGEFVTGWDALDFVRDKREIAYLFNPITDNFNDELLKEYRKETFAEGQAFLNYKRLYHSIPTMGFPIAPGDTGGNHPNGIYYPVISDNPLYEWLPKNESDYRRN